MRFMVSSSAVRRPKGSFIGLLHEDVSTGLREGCHVLPHQSKSGTARLIEPNSRVRAMITKTVMLDLVQPLAAGRQFIGFGRKARRDEPGREGAHTQHNAAYLGTIAAHLNLFDCASHAFG